MKLRKKMNHKTQKMKLQEYCQHHLPGTVPIYTSVSEGPPNMLQWKSSVTVDDKKFQSDTKFPTKREAEHNVAGFALEELLLTPLPLHDAKEPNMFCIDGFFPQSKKIKHHVFIDLENVQPTPPSVNFSQLNMNMYVFLSSYSPVKTDAYISKGATIFTIESNAKEAVDHYMSYMAGKLVSRIQKDDIIVIVSRDRSSGILCDILKEEGYTVKRIFNKEQFNDFLQS